jgi:hypothetical protein
MTKEDFIIGLFYRIDDQMKDIDKYSQANLYPAKSSPLFLSIEKLDKNILVNNSDGLKKSGHLWRKKEGKKGISL